MHVTKTTLIWTVSSLIVIGTLFLCGCGDDNEKPEQNEVQRYIYLLDANNYTFESSLYIPSLETAATTDIEICWEGLTRDIQCHDMNPEKDINTVSLVRLKGWTEQDVADSLSRGDLPSAAASGYMEFNTDGASVCVNLNDFDFGGTAVNVEEEYTVNDENTYLIVVASGTIPGVGARMMTFIHPSVDSDVRRVDITEDCDVLEFEADLSGITPVMVPQTPPLTVDWTEITRNGQGGTPSFGGIDGADIGFYAGMTPADLEDRVLDLFLIADKTWHLELNGRFDANLEEAHDDEGNPFTGFEGDGTWVFTLTCSACQNPAPQFVTLFEPVES